MTLVQMLSKIRDIVDADVQSNEERIKKLVKRMIERDTTWPDDYELKLIDQWRIEGPIDPASFVTRQLLEPESAADVHGEMREQEPVADEPEQQRAPARCYTCGRAAAMERHGMYLCTVCVTTTMLKGDLS